MKYVKHQKIGSGTYSDVYICKKNNKDTKYAMKIYKTKELSFDVVREISILKSIDSPYIINLIYISEDLSYIILPYFPYTLSSVLNYKYDRISVFKDICLGIYTLHSKNIIHRDIKPSNICIRKEDNKFRAVLIDFGFSRRIEYNEENSPKICTVWYRPPEIICRHLTYSFGVDIWAAGCILGEMYLKDPLFPHDSELQILKEQAELVGVPKNLSFKCPFTFSEENMIDLAFENNPEILPLIKNMLKFDPEERYTIAQCLNSFGDIYTEAYLNYDYYLENVFIPIEYTKLKKYDKMRKVVMEWMCSVCKEYSNMKVYFSAIQVFDLYISKKCIEIEKYQILGLACLSLMFKYDSTGEIEIEDFSKVAKPEDVYIIESDILKNINTSLPNIHNYYTVYNKTFDFNEEGEEEVMNLLYKCTLFPEFYKYKFAMLVGVCCYIVMGNQVDKSILSEEEYDTLKNCFEDISKWCREIS